VGETLSEGLTVCAVTRILGTAFLNRVFQNCVKLTHVVEDAALLPLFVSLLALALAHVGAVRLKRFRQRRERNTEFLDRN
jgi:hypothetical protein